MLRISEGDSNRTQEQGSVEHIRSGKEMEGAEHGVRLSLLCACSGFKRVAGPQVDGDLERIFVQVQKTGQEGWVTIDQRTGDPDPSAHVYFEQASPETGALMIRHFDFREC